MSDTAAPDGPDAVPEVPAAPAAAPAPLRLLGRAAWLVGALAFALRAVWVLAFARVPTGLSDPFLYHGYGLRIAAGRGYRSLVDDLTAYYPPGYPYLVGGLYKLADLVGLDGHRALVVGLAQSAMWAVAAMAVVVTGRALWEPPVPGGPGWGARAGVAGGLVLACWPNLITYAGAYLSESIFVCVLAVALAALSLAARAPAWGRRWWWSVAVAALFLGAATMVRPQVLLGLPLVAVAWLVGGLGWRRTLVLAAACTVGVAGFVVPWAIRNQGVFGHPVLVSTNGGDNLCVGFHPGAGGGFEIPPYCDTGEFWNNGHAAEFRRNGETRRRAVDWVTAHPAELPWLSARKLWYTYRADDDGLQAAESYGRDVFLGPPWRGLWVGLGHVYYALVMVAALVGLVVGSRRAWSARPRDAAVLAMVAMAVAGMLVPVLFFGDTRFKVPTTPLFALFAGLAVVAMTRWGRRDQPAPAQDGGRPPDASS